MVWVIQSSVSFTAADDAKYRPLIIPNNIYGRAWGVSAKVLGEMPGHRRRNGFIVPYVGVDDRTVNGPSEAVHFGIEGNPETIHLLTYPWSLIYQDMIPRIAGYGVQCVPERGAFPCTFTLWRLD